MLVYVAVAVAVAGITAWLAVVSVTLVTTRPSVVRPDPATFKLGSEPPAVVNLLTNRCRLTMDAAGATLLDLAARRILELHQVEDDPAHTTIHILVSDPSELRPYERQVLDRVRTLAVDGVVPLYALAFRSRALAWSWQRSLRQKVVQEARSRGLSRQRLSDRQVDVLWVAGLVAGLSLFSVTALALVTVVLLLFAAEWLARWERETAAGVAAKARWLGVRDWLEAHDNFGSLPPAAVAVWDRYLAYGTALGVTSTASAMVNLGLGDVRRVWSSYGGRWRRVRVHYPRLRPHYGVEALWLGPTSVVTLGVGLMATCGAAATETPGLIGVATLVSGYSAYLLVRSVRERWRVRVVTGEVLLVRPWRPVWFPAVWLHHLVVDDGTTDRVTAFALHDDLAATVERGATVRITACPLGRRVTTLEVLEHGPRVEPDSGAEPTGRRRSRGRRRAGPKKPSPARRRKA